MPLVFLCFCCAQGGFWSVNLRRPVSYWKVSTVMCGHVKMLTMLHFHLYDEGAFSVLGVHTTALWYEVNLVATKCVWLLSRSHPCKRRFVE
jgi:hypothetical protein